MKRRCSVITSSLLYQSILAKQPNNSDTISIAHIIQGRIFSTLTKICNLSLIFKSSPSQVLSFMIICVIPKVHFGKQHLSTITTMLPY